MKDVQLQYLGEQNSRHIGVDKASTSTVAYSPAILRFDILKALVPIAGVNKQNSVAPDSIGLVPGVLTPASLIGVYWRKPITGNAMAETVSTCHHYEISVQRTNELHRSNPTNTFSQYVVCVKPSIISDM
ncbi:hypothetical protein SFRURICE_021251 [Spodoptera frugiperda]|nr:hypothetical protein SFRURICE_021251 [Spodoptera frugiperda]